MLSRTSLLVLIYHVLTGITAPATYDQRQTGNLNVQVHWKDLQIIALYNQEKLDDYTEYDYFYTDYGDFTNKPTDTSEKPEVGESLNSTQSLPPSSESAVSNSTVEDSNELSALNSTVEDSNEPSALNSTVEDSNESSVLNSTVENSNESSVLDSTVEDSNEPSALYSSVEDSNESSALNSTVEDSNKTSALNSTVEDSNESSELNSTVEVSNESSALNSTIEDLNESLVLNSTVEDSSKPSTANTEGSTEATIKKTEKSISENKNIRNTSVDGTNEEQQLGLPPQRNRTRLTRQRCRSGCPADGKGHCCRMSNRRLSLIPLAIELTPKILDNLVRSVKRQPS